MSEPSLFGLARVSLSDDRARQLRFLLVLSLVTCAFLLLVAGLGFGTGHPDFGVAVGMPAVLLTAFTIASLIQLRLRNGWARLLSAMTGGLLTFVGLLVIRNPLVSLSVALAGVLLVVQALRRDHTVV